LAGNAIAGYGGGLGESELKLFALALADKVHLRRVSEERLLILKDGHCLRDEPLAVCARAKARFAGQFEADQFLTIFELIRAGFGVSIVPEIARNFERGMQAD
jgi:LysR family transcriptional regulator, hydrogen peroxide-inducible genes activator